MWTHWHVLSLTTLCSLFRLSYSNQAMTQSAHWCSWSCDLHMVGFFSQENTTEGHTQTHKSSFVPYKQVGGMVIMNNLE